MGATTNEGTGQGAATTIAVQAALLTGEDVLTVDKSKAMLTITEYVS